MFEDDLVFTYCDGLAEPGSKRFDVVPFIQDDKLYVEVTKNGFRKSKKEGVRDIRVVTWIPCGNDLSPGIGDPKDGHYTMLRTDFDRIFSLSDNGPIEGAHLGSRREFLKHNADLVDANGRVIPKTEYNPFPLEEID